MKKAWIAVVIVLFVGLVAVRLVVAGNDEDEPGTSNQTAQNQDNQSQEITGNTEQATSTSEVVIKNSTFSPEAITVKKGTTVKWTNSDSSSHTVTADNGDGPDSQSLGRGETYEFTFNETGTFAYHCEFHRGMMGEVLVTE